MTLNIVTPSASRKKWSTRTLVRIVKRLAEATYYVLKNQQMSLFRHQM